MTRQKTSKRLLLVMLLCVIMVVSLALTACNGGKHVITWKIDEHATVIVEGAKKLPEKAKDGEAIEFTITTEAGYVVDEVLRDNKTVNANSSGKYSVTVSADVTITVTTKREISGIKVTQKPTKLTYEAGETLDKTGMVVQLEHTVGEPETITDYRIRYQGGTAASGFQLGDKTFQVYYDEHFATVELDDVVAAHITLDLVGATVSDDYIATLSAIEGIQDVKQENGLVTFKFTAPLTDNLPLPTRAQIAKGEEEGDYVFNAWQINGEGDWISSLSSETVTSQVLKANFTAHLAVLDSVDYEAVEGIPYLVVNGTFKAAKSVYVLLTEGNRKISFAYDKDAASGNRGESFTLRVNMLEIVTATAQDGGSFVGPWLDLRLAYDVDGRTENMELPYNASYEQISVRDGNDNFRFGFAQWGGNLKVAITVVTPYTYTLSVDNTDDVLTLTISGKIVKALDTFVGAKVVIDWWMNATIGPVEAVIAEDGSWEIVFELSPENGFILDTLGYAHFKIVDNTGSEMYKDGNDGNLLANALENRDDLTHHDIPHGQFNGDSLEISNSAGTMVYYVGIPDWDAIVIYGLNPLAPQFSVSGDVELKVDDFGEPTKVFYLVKLTVEKNLTEDQVFAIVLGNIDGTTDVFNSNRELSTINGNVYTLWFDITDYSGSQLWPNLYMPVGEGDDVTYEKCSVEVGGDTDHSSDGLYAIVNGIKYSIICNDGTWNRPCVTTETAAEGEKNPPEVNPDAIAKQITIDGASFNLVAENGKAYVVVQIFAVGFPGAKEIKASIMYGNTDLHDPGEADDFEWKTECAIIYSIESSYMYGTYELWFDITNVKVDTDGRLWSNLYLDGEKIEIHDTEHVTNGISVTVGETVYTIECTGDGGTWNIPCITLSKVDDGKKPEDDTPVKPTPEYAATLVELVKEGEAVYLVINGTYTNYDVNELKGILEAAAFDMQYNANLGAPGWDNFTNFAKSVTVNADGKWQFKANITSLEGYAYTVHFNGDVKLSNTSTDGTSVTVGTKTFTLVNKNGEAGANEDGTRFWGGTGVIVKDTAAKSLTFTGATLEQKDNNIYFVLAADFANYTEDELKTITYYEGNKDTGEVKNGMTLTVESVEIADGTVKLYFNFTNVNADGEWWWGHWTINGEVKGDVKCKVVEKEIVLGGKKYALHANEWDNIYVVVTPA